MGQIKNIITREIIETPLLNNRFTIELCENVHMHYRNLRMEFPKEEFILILQKLRSLSEEEIKAFKYDKKNFMSLICDTDLPNTTEFNDRLQIEEQVNGQYHIHYKNLRLELRKNEGSKLK